MTAKIEREALKAKYKSAHWSQKVDKMSDDQVIAIYLQLKRNGKI